MWCLTRPKGCTDEPEHRSLPVSRRANYRCGTSDIFLDTARTPVTTTEREVEKYTPIPRAYRLDKVEWLHLGNYMNDTRKWIYLVTFERQYSFEGQRFEARGTLTIPVLLDGRVIAGKKSDGSGR